MTWDIFSMVTHMWALLLWQADDHEHTCRWYWSLTYLPVITYLIQWLLVGWSRLDPSVSGCIHESRRIVNFFTMSRENKWVYLLHSYIYIKISYSKIKYFMQKFVGQWSRRIYNVECLWRAVVWNAVSGHTWGSGNHIECFGVRDATQSCSR